MMGEKNPFHAQVSCLSGILDIQRTCQKEELRFSKETNQFLLYHTLKKVGPWVGQKLISKLVEQGQLTWDENEEYDVEQILDHILEDDNDFYLIKWKGWSRAYNSWEPKENLDCPELVTEFHALNSDKNLNTYKRPATWDIETERNTKKRRLDELWAKLNTDNLQGKITPLQLLSASSPQKTKGLLAKESKAVTKSRKLRFQPAPNYADKKKKSYKDKKREVERALKEWQDKLNSICNDPASIVVENVVDLEGPPDNFEYINDYRPGDGIEIPQDPLIGCDCTDCFDTKKSCCPANCGTEFAYYKHKRVRIPPGTPIYECNKRCACSAECPNRVVQHGRKCKISVFRTHNGRGWGVKTLQKIKKGSFVIEYVGEVITNEEAERRGKVYDAECRTYLFDLDYNDGDCPFTVDARFYGNVSHFVNHSCDPNLLVYGVWINTLDPRLPRIALFSGRDIDKGEELTFDYMMTGDTTQLASPPPVAVPPLLSEEPEPFVDVTGEDSPNSPSKPSDVAESIAPKGNVQEDAVSSTNSALMDGSPTKQWIPVKQSSSPVKQSSSPVKQSSSPVKQSSSPKKQPAADGSGDRSTEVKFTPGKEIRLLASQAPEAVFASPRRSSSANKKEQYRIVCQCGAKNCRKYLF